MDSQTDIQRDRRVGLESERRTDSRKCGTRKVVTNFFVALQMSLQTFGKVRASGFEILTVELMNNLVSWDMRPYSLVYKYEPLGESFCFPVHYHDDGSCKLLKTLKEKLSSKIQRSYTRTVVSAGSVCLICRRQFRYQSCSRLGGPRGRFRWVQKISPPLPPPLPQGFEYGTVLPTQTFTVLYISQCWKLNWGDFRYVRACAICCLWYEGNTVARTGYLFTFNNAGSKQRSKLLISNYTTHFNLRVCTVHQWELNILLSN